MTVLVWVTLIWAAVLVLAVAASLLAIWLVLRRIGGTLAEVREALAEVSARSEPLEGHLKAVDEPLADAEEVLSGACRRFTDSSGERIQGPAGQAAGSAA